MWLVQVELFFWGGEEVIEFIGGAQGELKFHWYTHTHTETHIQGNAAPEVDSACLGSQISESGMDLQGLRKPGLKGIT